MITFKKDNDLGFQKSGGDKSSGLFVSLKDGDKVRGVLAGEIFEHKPINKFSGKPTFKFKVNFIVNENGMLKAKILDQGITVYKALRALADSGYDLTKTVVVISRTGSGKDDTTYAVLPAPNGALDAEMQKQYAAVKLNELKPAEKDTNPFPLKTVNFDSEALPF